MPTAVLIPNADGPMDEFVVTPSGSSKFSVVAEDPDAHDGDAGRLTTFGTAILTQDLGLTDAPSDFGGATGITVKIAAAKSIGFPDLGVQFMVNGVSQGEVIPNISSGTYQVFSMTFPGWDKAWTKAEIDAAWLRFVMYPNGKDNLLKVSAARVLADYVLASIGGSAFRSSVFG